MTARYIISDVFEGVATLDDDSVDLAVTSPPFLRQRSYLPDEHPDKGKEIGSEADPAEFLDTLLSLTAALDRVIAPHGSLVFELGDKYSGSGGPGGDYDEGGLRDGQPDGWGKPDYGDGWPLDKSLCMTPALFAASLAYGRNLLTGKPSPAGQWRIRNVIPWCRPNPPVGALGDKWRPATSYVIVACRVRDRWFDLDAVAHARDYSDEDPTKQGAREFDRNGTITEHARTLIANPAGAPPLDWFMWDDPESEWSPDDGMWVIPTAPFKGVAKTVRQVRVPADADDDGSQRTTSPDCPMHGLPDHPGSSARGGARAAGGSSHNAHNGDHPSLALDDDSPPTIVTLDLLASVDDSADRAAIRRSTPSSRTDPAPATNPAGTPSAQTPDRTDGTPIEPSSSGLHPDTPANSSEAVSLNESDLETSDRTGRSPSSASACTCSWYREESVTESTSHYACWPPKLVHRIIDCMCPREVCRVCGLPRRRIVEDAAEYEAVKGQRGFSPEERRGNDSHLPTALRSNGRGGPTAQRTTLGWTDCGHDDYRPGIVLDPFAGSGTTLAVASGLGRDSIGIDLDERNADLAMERVGPLFLTVEHPERTAS